MVPFTNVGTGGFQGSHLDSVLIAGGCIETSFFVLESTTALWLMIDRVHPIMVMSDTVMSESKLEAFMPLSYADIVNATYLVEAP